MAEADVDANQELGFLSRCPILVAGAQGYGPFSAFLQTREKLAGIQTEQPGSGIVTLLSQAVG